LADRGMVIFRPCVRIVADFIARRPLRVGGGPEVPGRGHDGPVVRTEATIPDRYAAAKRRG
jgi:hypothetical protein